MTEKQWFSCTDPTKMLEFLRRIGSDRKLRLFTVACCRRIWPLLGDERSRHGVEVAERFADDLATEAERADAWQQAHNVASERVGQEGGMIASAASRSLFSKFENRSWCSRAASAAEAARLGDSKEPQADLLRDIFGPLPFRPVTLAPVLLTSTVVQLAQTIYEERAWDRMPILGDALEGAGCDNSEVLSHCRSAGPHVRGCWVVDLILGQS